MSEKSNSRRFHASAGVKPQAEPGKDRVYAESTQESEAGHERPVQVLLDVIVMVVMQVVNAFMG